MGGGGVLLGGDAGSCLQLLCKELSPPHSLPQLPRFGLLFGLEQKHLLLRYPLSRGVARVIHHKVIELIDAVCLAVDQHVGQIEVSDYFPLVPIGNLVRLSVVPTDVHGDLHAEVNAAPDDCAKTVPRLPPPVQPVAVEEREQEAEQPPHERHREGLRLEGRQAEGQLGEALWGHAAPHCVQNERRGTRKQCVDYRNRHQPSELPPDGTDAEDGPLQVGRPPHAGEKGGIVLNDLALPVCIVCDVVDEHLLV
mmetsp:Transcript_8194/g.20113  ORF Transcript_8194/g.20113 Transcript_8194/m.20113 type:complete len:252 (-) Transcript_8194:309-1064(-)